MLFGTLMWVVIILIPLQTSPEFVVHEIEACCHHRIVLSCNGASGDGAAGAGSEQQKNMRIVVVQARYVIDQEEKIAATAVPSSSQPLDPTQQSVFRVEDSTSDNHPTASANHRAISLWDLDIKFVHDLINDNLPYPVHVNAPPWHPSHISTYEGKQPFLTFQQRYRKFTTPPVFPDDGFNFSDSRVIQMPPYRLNFLDKETIWRQPLFQIGSSVNNIYHPYSSSTGYLPATPRSIPATSAETLEGKTSSERDPFFDINNDDRVVSKSSSRDSRSESSYYLNQDHGFVGEECWSYQALSSTSATFTTDANRLRPPWHFKDLRAYFNQRCSGRSKCTVELLRGKQPDPDVTKLCHLLPEGKITVKYLCYNASSEIVHSRCNVDVTPANEGFLHNPGYPDIYPGDQPCQWRLHVPQQKILLVFFDISLRGQEKSICRDELVASEEHSKLLSTCGDHSSAVAILSKGHQLNVTLIPKSRLAYPKRGFLIYYRVLGCRDPARPINSYIVFRNATHAYLLCDLGHIYPDTLTRERWLYCNPLEHVWVGTTSHCQDIRDSTARGNLSIAQVLRNNPSWWPVSPGKERINKEDIISDYILPVCVLLALFIVNGFVLCFIWKQRQRLEEMENERNQEMEEICAAVIEDSNSPVDESFSFPSSGVDEFAWHDPFDDDIDETDQDRTLTTLTLHTTSSPPDSAAAMKHYYDSSRCTESRNGGTGNSYYRFSQDGSSSGIFSNSGLISTTLYTSFHHQQLVPPTAPPPPPPVPSRPTDLLTSLNFANGNGIRSHQQHHHRHNQNGGVSGIPNGNGDLMGGAGHGSFPGTHHYFGFSTRTTDV